MLPVFDLLAGALHGFENITESFDLRFAPGRANTFSVESFLKLNGNRLSEV